MSDLNGFREPCCGRVLRRGQSCLDGYDNGRYYTCLYARDRRRGNEYADAEWYKELAAERCKREAASSP